MKPISLRLKGFIGIKKGMGLDELTLNLSDLPAGIIVLSAANGSGKTTILDNLSPYRVMPYKANRGNYSPNAFSYYGQVRGEAQKEFIFDMDGERYRSLINIDGDRKKQEAYLYRSDAGKWQALPGIDGKLDPYDRAVVEVCGTPELFFTSVFRCQKAKAISDYSKGDIKEIIAELIGAEGNKLLSEKARRVKQELAGKTEILMFERKRIKDVIDREPGLLLEKDGATQIIVESEQNVRILTEGVHAIQEEINGLGVAIAREEEKKAEAAKFEAKILDVKQRLLSLGETILAKDETFARKIETIKAKGDQVRRDYNRFSAGRVEKKQALQEKIEKAARLIENGPKLKERARNKVAIEKAVAELKEDLARLEQKYTEYSDKLRAITETEVLIAAKEKELHQIETAQMTKQDTAGRCLKEAQQGAEKLKTVPCTKDIAAQCRFVKDAVEAQDRIPELEMHLERVCIGDERIPELTAAIEELREQTRGKATVALHIKSIEKDRKEKGEAIRGYEQNLATISQALELLPRVELAEQQIPEYRAEMGQIEAESGAKTEIFKKEIGAIDQEEIDVRSEKEATRQGMAEDVGKLEIEVNDLEILKRACEIVGQAAQQKEALLYKIRERTEVIESARRMANEYHGKLGAIEQALADAEKATGKLEGVNARITYLADEAGQWGVLEQAFGNDGIIALEIDDAGPSISALTNELLQVYSGVFSIRFETQGVKADGGIKEQFAIMVLDGRNNEAVNLTEMSGGERDFIEDAITKSIAIYNAQSSGKRYQTLFTDEKDGALDSEKKREFFAIKKRVLELGGYERELAITQTPELLAMADAVIRLKKGGYEIST